MATVPRMSGKVCLVTGANSGIGKVTAEALASLGAHVIMVCRDRARGEAAAAEIERGAEGADIDLLIANLSSQASIRELAAEINRRYDRLDVLVNNAGALHTSRSVTVDGYETTFATNHLAYFLLTNLLLDLLKKSAPSRIVNVSSRAHVAATMRFDDLQSERGYSPSRVYGQSKLANVLFTNELARQLEGTGVTANALHPGVVRTGFAKNNTGLLGGLVACGARVAGVFFVSAERGAETSIYLASSDEVEGVTGKYFSLSRETPSNAESRDPEIARQLWEISEQLTGIVTPVAVGT